MSSWEGTGNDKLFGLGGPDLLKGEAGTTELNGGAGWTPAGRAGPDDELRALRA